VPIWQVRQEIPLICGVYAVALPGGIAPARMLSSSFHDSYKADFANLLGGIGMCCRRMVTVACVAGGPGSAGRISAAAPRPPARHRPAGKGA